MRRRQFVTGITISVLAGSRAWADEPRHIVMASLVGNGDGFAARWLKLIYSDAFKQLGIELEIRAYPAARAAAESAADNVDGELARSFEYEDTHPNLIRVSEPTFYANTIAYATRSDIKLEPGYESLRDTSYRIEHRLGYPIMTRKLAAVVAPANLSEVRNAETGLRKLVLGRSDLYVDVEDTVTSLLSWPEFRGVGIRPVAVMDRGPVHAYLNRRYAQLAPRLGAIIKKMRDSGQIERYRQQAMHQN
ncbi:hypothetical protein GTP46_05630 [Duganella sp. FT135W]|uniref:Transporter substrate-binding domain-containing protein n=1 Tax=Duganella flavida TaxID=2692175 RepID=A0A6L8K8A7_9BURK|nr:hypothetical protein [Duganella flavida]MYM22122.1 hypothetical protein [Duganella flavida]